jgi:hypothetical protein
MATTQGEHNVERPGREAEQYRPSWLKAVSAKASNTHARVPGANKLPFPAFAIIVFLILVNIAVWIAAGVVLVC